MKYRSGKKGRIAAFGIPLAIFLILAAVPSAAILIAVAYENDASGRTMKDGPHRVINGLALKQFMTSKQAPAVFAKYEFQKLRVLQGEGVVRPGWVHFDTAYQAGTRSGSFIWWIKEGGYTADEPELYASFRHFYDPTALNGSTYLTDHLETIDWYYQLLSTKVSKQALGRTFYPQVDARDWAISGPEREGIGRNEYCWERGLEAMRQAFAATDPVEKDRLYAKAWRALGETMHLVSDMTSPAHVRNDSHPGLAIGAYGFGETNPNEGLLKADPYDSYCSHHLVTQYAGGGVESGLQEQITAARDPAMLFDAIARYTQENFFTPDTISGVDRLGRAVTNANGQRAYPSPKLKPADFRLDSGHYVKLINDRSIRMTHESWLLSTGWGSPLHAMKMTYPCVQDQASILIPVAIAGCMRLADWFVPKIEVRLESYDPEKGLLKGRVTHLNRDSAYASPLVFNASDPPTFHLYMNGGLQNWDKIRLQVQNGEITADLSKLDVPEEASLVLILDIGGMRVSSEELKLGEESVLAYLKKAKSATFRLDGVYKHSRGGTEQHHEEYSFNRRDAEIQGWSWNGNSFEITWKKTYTNYGGVWEGATRTVRLSGSVSSDGRMLSSCSLKVDTAFKDGPQEKTATLTGLKAHVMMPEPSRPYFVCMYRGSGPGVASCVITTQTGSVHTVQSLEAQNSSTKAELEFNQ